MLFCSPSSWLIKLLNSKSQIKPEVIQPSPALYYRPLEESCVKLHVRNDSFCSLWSTFTHWLSTQCLFEEWGLKLRGKWISCFVLVMFYVVGFVLFGFICLSQICDYCSFNAALTMQMPCNHLFRWNGSPQGTKTQHHDTYLPYKSYPNKQCCQCEPGFQQTPEKQPC